jgi:hypothetical protein
MAGVLIFVNFFLHVFLGALLGFTCFIISKIFLLFFLSSFFQNSKGIYRSGNEQTQSCGNAQTQSSRNAEAKPLNPSMPLTKILASRL